MTLNHIAEWKYSSAYS